MIWLRKAKLNVPGRVAQSVTCLATDACLTADPGVATATVVTGSFLRKNVSNFFKSEAGSAV